MAHYAEIVDNKVVNVIVADQSFIDGLVKRNNSEWIQTSYNTYGGAHNLGGTPLRKNFAGIGMVYDKTRDAFYAPKPYPSWTLNETTCIWEPPTACPDDGKIYEWNEDTTSWKEIT